MTDSEIIEKVVSQWRIVRSRPIRKGDLELVAKQAIEAYKEEKQLTKEETLYALDLFAQADIFKGDPDFQIHNSTVKKLRKILGGSKA